MKRNKMETNAQIKSYIGQPTFSSTFRIQSSPTTVILQHIEQKHNTHRKDNPAHLSSEILEKRERILELQKEIEDSEEEIQNKEREEEDFDPEKGEEDIFDVLVPDMESDLYGLRIENEIEIKLLEEEIAQMEKKK